MIGNKKRAAENAGEEGSTEDVPEIKKKKLPTTKNSSNDKKKFQKPTSGKFFGKDGKGGGKPFGKDGFKKKLNDNDKPEEKKDWQKYKQEKKDLRLKRRQTKDSYDVSTEAKKIYELLKCRKTENKKELVEKLYKMIKGDTIKKLVMAHDTARIIQCMLKFASPKLRDEISEDLLPIAVDMSISKYAHFCVLRMFKYGSPKIKEKVVNSFLGSIIKLASHNVSSKILDHVYLTVANNQQKIYMRQEFYGDLYKKIKDSSVKKISDTYSETPHIKAAVLGAVKANLEHVANKKLIDSALIHSVLLEYLKESEPDKIEETIGLYASMIPSLLTTKDGCHASMLCFWNSAPKGRRAIVKVIKEHLVKICIHEQGHLFILAVLSSMDDTKAIKKAIFDPIFSDIQTVIANQWGRKVIEWFISPGGTASFHPSLISFIEKGQEFGKKDKEIRRQEIFEQIEEPLANSISENPELFLTDGHAGLFLATILNKLSASNFSKAADAVSKIICKEDWTVNVIPKKENKKEDCDAENIEVTQTIPGIEDAGLHMAINKVLKADVERSKKDEESFGSILVKNLCKETIHSWLNFNRGCFVLVNIFQYSNDSTKSTLKELLKTEKVALKKQKNTGAKILLEKLALK